MDDEKKAEEVTEDVGSSPDTKAVDKTSSQKPHKFSKEEEAEVQKRVSDILAEKGDKVKPLEGRVKDLEGKTAVLETENKTLKEERLSDMAAKFGLTLENVKEAGLDDPAKIETLANLFGNKGDETSKSLPKTQKVDPGTTDGGGELTDQQKLDKRYPTMKK